MHQICALTALCAISRHQNIGFRHDLTQDLPLLRISGAHHGSYITVGIAHAGCAPGCHLLSHDLIKRPVRTLHTSYQPVLKLPAAGIGRLHQNKKTFLLFLTHLDKRLHPIGTKIGVHRHKIFVKSSAHGTAHLHLSQMAHRIGFRCRTDITALDITDDHQPFLLTIFHGLLEGDKPFHAELLIHGDLRLHRRDQIVDGIHDRLVIQPDRLCRSLHRLPVLRISLLLYMLRHELQNRIQPGHDGRPDPPDLLYKLVDHSFLPSKSCNTYVFSIYRGISSLEIHFHSPYSSGRTIFASSASRIAHR